MADVVDAATRSRMMRGIRSTDTKPELRIRSLLHRRGFRFRLHARDLPGKPDIVLPCYRAVLFVHGCFWHGHACPLFRLPSTRRDFWKAKIDRNRATDARAQASLGTTGWRVGTVWECAMKGTHRLDEARLIDMLDAWLRSNASSFTLAGNAEREK